jgi:hypothetical protein
MNYKLRLSAGPLQRHHGRACDLGCRFCTEVLAYEVKTEIKSCRRPGRREHGTVVNIQDAGIDIDFRVTLRQFLRSKPVGCCAPTVKRTRRC